MDEGAAQVREEYRKSLKDLRQDIGCTPERLRNHEELLDALRRRSLRRGATGDAEACLAELRAIVESLHDPKHRDALLAALRLDPRYQERHLNVRRSSYNEDLKRASDPNLRLLRVDSLRTLERRENAAIKIVAQLLAESPSPGAGGKRANAADAQPTGLVNESVNFVCHYSAGGVITRNIVRRSVRALVPDAPRTVDVSHQYYGGSHAGVLHLRDTFGCRVADQESGRGIVRATIELAKRLRPEDGVYSYGYTVEVDSTRRAEPIFRYRPRDSRSLLVDIHLLFDPAMTPVNAWWFSTRSLTAGLLEPGREQGRHFDLSAGETSLYKSFEGKPLDPEMFYGIAWDWPD